MARASQLWWSIPLVTEHEMSPSRTTDRPPATSTLSSSPLFLVTREPALHALVGDLQRKRREILDAPEAVHRLELSREQRDQARAGFRRMLLSGEEGLHRLCELLCDGLYREHTYRLRGVVVGQNPVSSERFTLMQPLSPSELYSHTDLDLGTRLLERIRVDSGGEWRRADLVVNFVEYEPLERNDHGVHKVISRIKAEEEIWHKVVDEIFDLDSLVARDKELRHLSRFVKDIFGVKLVVGSAEHARELQATLESLTWSEQTLERVGAPADRGAAEMTFLEVKDYLADDGAKASGWRALKSAVIWCHQLFELQIQPLRNYHDELERFTVESHDEFKRKREALRNTVAAQTPLFGFYRDLLRWYFDESKAPPPSFGRVRVEWRS